jgi:hypothetical protein
MSLPRCCFCRYNFHPRSCVRSQRLEGTKCPAKARLTTSLEWIGTVHRPNEHVKINTNSDLFDLIYVFLLYVERLLHNIQLGHMKRCTGYHVVPVGSHVLSAVIKQQSRTFRPYGAEPFLRSCQLCSYSRTSPHFMEPEGSQERSTAPYPDPHQSNPYHRILPL